MSDQKKLDQETKALWLSSLRSGTFAQGSRQLHRLGGTFAGVERFCCLGVLCKATGMPSRAHDVNGDVSYYGDQGIMSVFYIPADSPLAWLNDIRLTICGEEGNLAEHNDGGANPGDEFVARKTFLEIANAIEAQL